MSTRRRHVLPFPLERARNGERANLPSLVDLQQELDELRELYIQRWDDPGAVWRRFQELIAQPGPRSFAMIFSGLVISLGGLEGLFPPIS